MGVHSTSSGQGNYQVRAVTRALSILELLRGHSDASLNELTVRSGLPKASVFRMIRTLEEAGFVEQLPNSETYRLGIRCLEFGQAYLEQNSLRSVALPVMERLRDEFNETVHLAVLDDELRVVYVEKLETEHAVGLMISRVGRSVPAHCTGIGKALLASRDSDSVGELDKHGILRRYTPNTIIDPETLRNELEKIRHQGFALDMEEHEPGVHCVACAIKGVGNETMAAVSIAGPSQRLPRQLLQEELATAVMESARQIGRQLGAVQTKEPGALEQFVD